MSEAHDALVERAEKWLKRQAGCGVVIRDPFRANTHNGERPDAIGWRDGLSILIECKVTRSDFHKDKRKRFRADPARGMGQWRFYMTPPGVVSPEDLPDGWGLLWCHPKKIQRVCGMPQRNNWWNYPEGPPFDANKAAECQMMASALRRLDIRGHFEEIYHGIPDGMFEGVNCGVLGAPGAN